MVFSVGSSIYNAPSIYESGAGGGGGEKKIVYFEPKRDVQNMTSDKDFYIENNILKKNNNYIHAGLVFPKIPFNNAQDSIEFQFRIKYDAGSSLYSQLFGDYGNFFRGPTIWRSPKESDKKSLVFAIPKGTDDWNGNFLELVVDDYPNDFFTIYFKFLVQLNKLVGFLVDDDGNILSDGEKILEYSPDYSRMDNHIMFDGAFGSIHYFLGQLDLSKSFIKQDGIRIF